MPRLVKLETWAAAKGSRQIARMREYYGFPLSEPAEHDEVVSEPLIRTLIREVTENIDKYILTIEQIRAHKIMYDRNRERPTPKNSITGCGVYFLFQGNDLIYVGKSVSFCDRFVQHERRMRFDGFSTIDIHQELYTALKNHYLHEFSPRLNARGTQGRRILDMVDRWRVRCS